ncbi:hypothetical protein O181_096660 [Austropuccinia psidii MF-1]|uniref:Polynucleotide 5'-hydroxyl-kinase GRC3 n=1 Tax=Austropuccinia psidii MF-1 TaxID=1389203 RepID=A0A9Q3J822_9BASI|nr:hypothetical protein [Austropuccinia psidii MF-1]
MACLLINPLLNTFDRVALLDINPGQPLLTPPSLISLHLLDSPIIGPTFYATNQLLTIYLLFQPSHQNSSSIHCQRYSRHLNQLDQTKISNQIPLVINTMGWTKGIGRELLDQLIQSIQPTKIFSFNEDESSNPIHSNDLEITKLQPIGPKKFSSCLTPADPRTLSLPSYLYSNPHPSSGQFVILWGFNQPLWCRYILNSSMIGLVDQNEKWCLRFGLICAINPI